MAEGKQKSDWDHTAATMTQYANSLRDRHAAPIPIRDFHPFSWLAPKERQENAGINAVIALVQEHNAARQK